MAQLGARFHGMEEVVGSIPTRSTIFSITYSQAGESSFASVRFIIRQENHLRKLTKPRSAISDNHDPKAAARASILKP